VAGLYAAAWADVMRAKLGLTGAEEGDGALAESFLSLLEGAGADWTLCFRALAAASSGDAAALRAAGVDPAGLADWQARWQARLARSGPGAAARVRAANPAVVPRNHMVEAALAAAEGGDLAPFTRLMEALSRPFEDRPGFEAYTLPPPAGFAEGFRTFCGT
ncbi:MAG TPA: protein adenylyltransferase SelO family protein, partial [Paracoccaceae bacterium]|nr:protein adenylyltransferase SelO family protein [Paracoccaceae bacterium]